MRIAFWGWKNSFDYFHIGGTESFVRRLAVGLNDNQMEVDYIMYGAEQRKDVEVNAQLKLKYFVKLEDALETLKCNYDHVVTIYLFPLDRLKFAHFRKKNNGKIKFHFVYTSWPDSSIKRWLLFLEARLFPYNGQLFCISKRQHQYLKQTSKKATYLMPPVPEDFFVEPRNKPMHEKIKITFLGRIDPGKGIEDVVEAFEKLSVDSRYECSIYGIHISGNEESVSIHNRLKAQNVINYIEVDRLAYSKEVENMVRNILRATDVFVQPYKRLSSTIDTPLLVLEAMASLCAVVTTSFGDIPELYGPSYFNLSKKWDSEVIIDLIKNSAGHLPAEKERLYQQNQKLSFSTSNIANIFRSSLVGDN